MPQSAGQEGIPQPVIVDTQDENVIEHGTATVEAQGREAHRMAPTMQNTSQLASARRRVVDPLAPMPQP